MTKPHYTYILEEKELFFFDRVKRYTTFFSLVHDEPGDSRVCVRANLLRAFCLHRRTRHDQKFVYVVGDA